MFFDFIPNSLTLVAGTLLPLYATHKALTTTAINPNPSSSVALLSPWLTYYAVSSLIPAAENNIPLLTWIPFYSWFRLFAHLYLLAPGETQGSTYVYREHIGPFLTQHERTIETAIKDVHDKAMQYGWGTVEQIWHQVRGMITGQRQPIEPRRTGPAPPASNAYVANLLGRFSAPLNANVGPASGTAGTVYGVLSSALGQAASAANPRGIPDQGLVPHDITNRDDKLKYISAQREKLSFMLGEFAAEESKINEAKSTGDKMRKSGSEVDFDRIEHDDLAYGDPAAQKSFFSSFWGSKDHGSAKKSQ